MKQSLRILDETPRNGRTRESERAKAIARLHDLWSIVYPRAQEGNEKALQQCLCVYELLVRIAGFKAAAPMARDISRLMAGISRERSV